MRDDAPAVKYCRDCVHMRDAHRAPFEKCAALSRTCLVTGTARMVYCDAARTLSGDCGPDGKLWEPKP